MNRMQIFEPAMCCSTGLCGVGIDQELLRISTVLSSLEKNDVKVERFNLSSAPQEFINNKEINDFIKVNGVDKLPVTILNGKIVLTGRYPTNLEFIRLLNVPKSYIGVRTNGVSAANKKSKGCGCSGGNCC